jgi:AhpD family alkylhydroperoxidase
MVAGLGLLRLFFCMSTTSVSPRIEPSKVNQLLGPALKSLYDIEAHLRKSTLEPQLRELIKLRVSQINGCAYCIIYHRRDALKLGVPERRIHLLNAWREASESEYSDRERAALAWAEAVTLISVHHLPDEVYAEAVQVFSEQELVDLNLAVMSINSWNRLSIAFRYEPERD